MVESPSAEIQANQLIHLVEIGIKTGEMWKKKGETSLQKKKNGYMGKLKTKQ